MKPTRDHASIRGWAKQHNAVPAEIKPLKFDGEPSILYFLIGKARSGTPDIHPISWEDFFARFDLLNLAMAWQDDPLDFELLKIEKASDASLEQWKTD